MAASTGWCCSQSFRGGTVAACHALPMQDALARTRSKTCIWRDGREPDKRGRWPPPRCSSDCACPRTRPTRPHDVTARQAKADRAKQSMAQRSRGRERQGGASSGRPAAHVVEHGVFAQLDGQALCLALHAQHGAEVRHVRGYRAAAVGVPLHVCQHGRGSRARQGAVRPRDRGGLGDTRQRQGGSAARRTGAARPQPLLAVMAGGACRPRLVSRGTCRRSRPTALLSNRACARVEAGASRIRTHTPLATTAQRSPPASARRHARRTSQRTPGACPAPVTPLASAPRSIKQA